jgi:hypothetical protein
MVQRQLPSATDIRQSLLDSLADHVPQEHNGTGEDSTPRGWSHMGRRVLAEAWRRFTDERVANADPAATPVAPAPFQDVER